MRKWVIALSAACAVFMTACSSENVHESAPAETSTAELVSDRTESDVTETTAEKTTEETVFQEQTAPTEVSAEELSVEVPENAAYKETVLNYSKHFDFEACQSVIFYDNHDNPILALHQAEPQKTPSSSFRYVYEYNSDGTKASEEYNEMHGTRHIDYEYSDGLLIKTTSFMNGNQEYVYSYTYDAHSNPVTSVYEDSYDETNVQTTYTYEYDDYGRIVSQITKNTDGYQRNEEFLYGENGKVKTHIDNDYKDEYIYDSDNRLIKLLHYDKDSLLWYELYEYEFY